MPTSPGGITYEELAGSPIVEYTNHGIVATRRFRVPWDDYVAFSREIGGQYTVVGSTVVATPPVPFPGTNPAVLVDHIRVEPFESTRPDGAPLSGLSTGTNRYDNGALVTVHYREMFYEVVSATGKPPNLPSVPAETFLTYEMNIGAELVVSPAIGWQWPNSKVFSDNIAPNILRPTAEHLITWHRVPSVPYSAIRNCRGKINSADVFSVPAGCLLFLGAKLQRDTSRGGNTPVSQVQYTFIERTNWLSGNTPAGWNYMYNHEPVSGQHWQEPVEVFSPNRKLYQTVDFTTLFNYE
jgi:hypothetical protein